MVRIPDADTTVSLTTLSFSPNRMSLGRVGLALLTSETMSPGWMTPLIMLPLPSVMLVTYGVRTQKSSDPCVALIGTTLTLEKEYS